MTIGQICLGLKNIFLKINWFLLNQISFKIKMKIRFQGQFLTVEEQVQLSLIQEQKGLLKKSLFFSREFQISSVTRQFLNRWFKHSWSVVAHRGRQGFWIILRECKNLDEVLRPLFKISHIKNLSLGWQFIFQSQEILGEGCKLLENSPLELRSKFPVVYQ